MNVAAIMKVKGRDVATARTTTSVEAASRLLAEKRIGALVVVGQDSQSEHGTVLGIISERDIIRGIAAMGQDCLAAPVSDLMTRHVVSCSENDTLDKVMSVMTAGRFRHMPVIDNDRLTGLISIGDVVKHHIAEVELEASAMKSYFVSG